MKLITTDQEIEEFLDKPSLNSIRELMTKDAPAYFDKINGKDYVWIPRLLLLHGSPHKGSKIQFGCSLLYLFRRLPVGFDMGIKEIKIMESMNEFLDSFNEINSDPNLEDKEITKY